MMKKLIQEVKEWNKRIYCDHITIFDVWKKNNYF